MTRFWLGGYGADMDGDAAGIGLLAGDEARPQTTLAYRGAVTPASSPSWLAQHPSLDVIYAALEGSGEVAAFLRTGESSLRPLGAPVAAGALVCHLAVDPQGRYLLASCYGDGQVVRIGLDADGRLVPDAADRAAALRAALFGDDTSGADTPDAGPNVGIRPTSGVSAPRTAPASDPYPTPFGTEPRVPHAHAAVFLRDGRIATTDLGFDLVRIWRAAASGLTLDHEVVLPRGSGPRHMVAHPSGHLHVVTEYSCEVFTLAADREGRWGLVAATPAASIAQVGFDFPAELAVSRDGETLYTALRGSNTIAALRVRGSGEVVEPFALADSGVDWPRHHLVYEGALLVAGQKSGSVSVLELDERTGAPRGIRHTTPAPTPTCILPVRA